MDALKPFGMDIGKGNINEEVVYLLALIYSYLFDDMSGYLSKSQLTPAKFNVLMILKHHGGKAGMRQGDLSQRLLVSTSNMSRVLEKLQREGLITLGGTATDRRIKLIRITPAATKLLDKVWPGYTQRLKDLTQALPEDKKRELSGILVQWIGFFTQKGGAHAR